jgi:flagellin-like protein
MMHKNDKNEEAVSPVIGVILMVAITVILAAIIAVFVLSMANTVPEANKVVGFAVSATEDGIVVTNMGGQDVGELKEVAIRVSGADCEPEPVVAMTGVGNTTLCDRVATGTNKDQVTITGTFYDNTEQVLLNSFI